MHLNEYWTKLHSNWFELIRIRSVDTLVTESEFDYKLCKLYRVGVW